MLDIRVSGKTQELVFAPRPVAASGIRAKFGAAVACAVSRYVLLIRISETARAYSSR
jgi:hypothetical protein